MHQNDQMISYDELAWTELIIAPEEEYVEETIKYVCTIRDNAEIEVNTLLHLGCGAGGHDHTFKRYFKTTGVDISESMLEIAKNRNPEVRYINGDMRTVRLSEKFDAIAIPDSIGYMTSTEDLKKALKTAYYHMRAGGVLLIVAHTAENFRENNFVYIGSKGYVEITLFENNYILNDSKYEATFVFLIRYNGKLEIHTDRHLIGMYKTEVWLKLLNSIGFRNIDQLPVNGLYDRYLLEEGEYPLKMLISVK